MALAEVEVDEAASPPLSHKAKLGLEPRFRNRFGALPELGPLPLPSSLSRRSAQLKATKGRKRWVAPLDATTSSLDSTVGIRCGLRRAPPTGRLIRHSDDDSLFRKNRYKNCRFRSRNPNSTCKYTLEQMLCPFFLLGGCSAQMQQPRIRDEEQF